MALQAYAGNDAVQHLQMSVVGLLQALLRRQLGLKRLLFYEKLFDLNKYTYQSASLLCTQVYA